MGNAHALRGRTTPAILLAVLLVLAVVVTLGVLARPAAAQDAYTTCATCHSSAKHSSNSTHANLYSTSSCTSCHANGFAAANKGVTPAACAACHGGVTAILAKNTHATTLACGTTPDCHGYTSPSPSPSPSATAAATTLTAKVSPTIVKLGKKVKVSGTAGPVPALAGAKIAFKVERKVGTKWVKMKAATTATVATLGPYSWTYKAVKKGSHRVTLTIKATTTFTAKKLVKTFKVK